MPSIFFYRIFNLNYRGGRPLTELYCLLCRGQRTMNETLGGGSPPWSHTHGRVGLRSDDQRNIWTGGETKTKVMINQQCEQKGLELKWWSTKYVSRRERTKKFLHWFCSEQSKVIFCCEGRSPSYSSVKIEHEPWSWERWRHTYRGRINKAKTTNKLRPNCADVLLLLPWQTMIQEINFSIKW